MPCSSFEGNTYLFAGVIMEFSNLRIGKYLTLDKDRVEKQVSCISDKICLRYTDFNVGEKNHKCLCM